MADSIFHSCGHLGKCLFRSVGQKNWIVTESRCSARITHDRSFRNSFKNAEEVSIPAERDDAAETSRKSGVADLDAPNLIEQFLPIRFIACPGPGITRRKNSRRSEQSINLQPRIIRQHQIRKVF